MININNKDIDYTEIIKNIVSSLKENFKLLLKNANFDKTFKAKIVENISGNKYKILYKGKYYTAISENELPVDKIVKVCAPQNNWSELFIVNSSSGTSQSVVLRPQLLTTENLDDLYGLDYIGRYFAVGGNTVAKKPSGVDAFHLEVNRSAEGWWYQQMIPSNELTNTMWLRTWGNGYWTAWMQIANKNDLDKKLNLSGGVMTGNLSTPKGLFVGYADSQSGTAGYLKVATIKIKQNYQNVPILFEVFQRGRNPRGLLSVMFLNVSNVDPGLASFYKSGQIAAYIHKSATSTWDIWVAKSEGYDNIAITYWATHHAYTQYGSALEVTFKDEFASSLPSGYVEATTSTLW